MRRGDALVFDEYVMGAVLATPAYTDVQHNEFLGSSDVLSIFAVVDQASATSSLLVGLEHSSDGRLWILKNPTALEIAATNNGWTAPQTAPAVMWGYSKGTNPSLGQGRLKIYFANGSVNAHVRIHVTARNPR